MKAKNLFFGALACLAFAACSNDDEPIVNGGQEEGGKYIAINVVNPVETRGTSTGENDEIFVAGSTAENTITSTLLLFYKDGTLLTAKTAQIFSGYTDVDQDNPNVEKVATSVAYLTPSETGNGLPTHIVALLNTTLVADDINSAKDAYSLTELKKKLDDYSSETSFVMSNSIYQDSEGNEVSATVVQPGNFQATATLAQANPVDIYVERVLAKVTVTNGVVGITSSEADNAPLFNDGTSLAEKAIVPVITGYHLAAKSAKSLLLKSLAWTSAMTWTGWNDYTNKRSYWAYTDEDIEELYNPYITQETTDPMYCLENTSATKTTLVALAQLKLKDGEGNLTDMKSFVKHGGFYYMEEDYRKNAAGFLGNETNKLTYGTTASNAWLDYVEIVPSKKVGAKPWEVTVQLKASASSLTDIKKNGVAYADTDEAIVDINIILNDNFDGAWMWTDGKAYFFVPIEHFGTVGSGAEVGVVRNHSYQLSISSAKGLGTPVYDPNEEIIPQTPDGSESLISARINILKWRIVKQQNIELQ